MELVGLGKGQGLARKAGQPLAQGAIAVAHLTMMLLLYTFFNRVRF